MQNPVPHEYRLITVLAVVVVLFGITFYHFVENLSWLDATYFSVITLATVGYGDITPQTPAGKIFTIFYVLIGISIITAFAKSLITRIAQRQLERLKNKRK